MARPLRVRSVASSRMRLRTPARAPRTCGSGRARPSRRSGDTWSSSRLRMPKKTTCGASKYGTTRRWLSALPSRFCLPEAIRICRSCLTAWSVSVASRPSSVLTASVSATWRRSSRPGVRSKICSSYPSRPIWPAPSGPNRACTSSRTRAFASLRTTQAGLALAGAAGGGATGACAAGACAAEAWAAAPAGASSRTRDQRHQPRPTCDLAMSLLSNAPRRRIVVQNRVRVLGRRGTLRAPRAA